MGVSKVRPIVLDFILFDPATQEIFYFKYDLGASKLQFHIGNPGVLMQHPSILRSYITLYIG